MTSSLRLTMMALIEDLRWRLYWTERLWLNDPRRSQCRIVSCDTDSIHTEDVC